MVKSGPCCHCGVTSTPLWRNGPPDKPVLCNACGTRWRTKGTLINYTPTHVYEQIDQEDYKVSRVKHTQCKLKVKQVLKVNQRYHAARDERKMIYFDQNFQKALEGDASNQSSSESASSYSESCANFETTEATYTGSVQCSVSPKVPSKNICAKPTQFEMLAKELHTIMNEQQITSLPSDLLIENESVMGSFEISTGSVLLRNSYPKIKEEESEASSFPFDNKSSIINEVYSGSASVSQSKHKKFAVNAAHGHVNRGKTYIEKLHYMQDKGSRLGITDLKDVKSKEKNGGTEEVIGTSYLDRSMLTPLKRVWDAINSNVSDQKTSMKSLNRKGKLCSISDTNAQVTNYGAKEFANNKNSFFTPESTVTLPPEQNTMLCSIQSTDDKKCRNDDLLIYNSNINSFPQCELVTLLTDAEESRTSFPDSTILSSQAPKKIVM